MVAGKLCPANRAQTVSKANDTNAGSTRYFSLLFSAIHPLKTGETLTRGRETRRERETEREREREMKRGGGRERSRETDRQTDRQTEGNETRFTSMLFQQAPHLDVLLHPVERELLVAQPDVARRRLVGEVEEAERPEAVVHRHDNDALSRQRLPVVHIQRGCPAETGVVCDSNQVMESSFKFGLEVCARCLSILCVVNNPQC